jgi:hypothetical protein
MIRLLLLLLLLVLLLVLLPALLPGVLLGVHTLHWRHPVIVDVSDTDTSTYTCLYLVMTLSLKSTDDDNDDGSRQYHHDPIRRWDVLKPPPSVTTVATTYRHLVMMTNRLLSFNC